MANTDAEDPSHLEAATVVGDDCEVKVPSARDYVIGDGTSREQPGKTVDHPSPQNIQACHRGDGEDRGAGNANINIPPWTIELAALIGPTEMELVNIPQNAQSEVAAIAPEIKYVSATYASELLKQIAGLTAIAKQRAHEARDLLCKHRKHTEALLSHQMLGVTAIQQDLIKPRNRDCRSHSDFACSPVPIYCAASTVWAAEHGVSETDKDGGTKALELKLQPQIHSSLNSATDKKASTRPAEEEGRLQLTTANPIAGACTNEVLMETKQPARRCDRREKPSVSLREEDVIYGAWKRTKSA